MLDINALCEETIPTRNLTKAFDKFSIHFSDTTSHFSGWEVSTDLGGHPPFLGGCDVFRVQVDREMLHETRFTQPLHSCACVLGVLHAIIVKVFQAVVPNGVSLNRKMKHTEGGQCSPGGHVCVCVYPPPPYLR